MSKIKAKAIAIHHVSVIISNCQNALTFYSGILGLEVSPDRPDLGYPGVWLILDENNEQQIHLLEFPEKAAIQKSRRLQDAHPGHQPHLALVVNNLTEIRGKLDNADIKYSVSRSGRPALFCSDGDGNVIELIETQQ